MIRLLKNIVFFVLLFAMPVNIYAQGKRVAKGVVVDEDGLSVIGAVVSAKTSIEHRNKICCFLIPRVIILIISSPFS